MVDEETKSSSKTFEKRVFSGVQPTGGLTLGNYLGAVKLFVEMQNEEYETLYCVVGSTRYYCMAKPFGSEKQY